MRHQPQPPGYPFFVALSRVAYLFAGSPEKAFTLLAIVLGSLAVGSMYLLGRQMFSAAVGFAAASLLFVNPIFWYTTLTSPLRLHLALISILTAYFCWRAIAGEYQYFYAAALVIGVGSGFRPIAASLMFPLLIWTAWRTRQWRLFLQGCGVIAACVTIWMICLSQACGGLRPMLEMFRDYFFAHSETATATAGGSLFAWRRMVGRAFLWIGIGAVPWLWSIPFGWSDLRRQPDWHLRLQFFVVWFLPAFFFSTLIHTASPGHTLVSIPLICLVGAFSIAAALRPAPARIQRMSTVAVWTLVIIFNAGLFMWPRVHPEPKGVGTAFRGWASVKDAASVGTYQTSLAWVRYRENRTALALSQIQHLKSADKPVLLIWANDVVPVWRKVSYYFPSDKVYQLVEDPDHRESDSVAARLWQGNTLKTAYRGHPVRVPVPRSARLVWLVDSHSADELRSKVPLQPAFPLYYTDMSHNSPVVRLGDFEFYAQ